MENNVSKEAAIKIAKDYFNKKKYLYSEISMSTRFYQQLPSDNTKSGWHISAKMDKSKLPKFLKEMDSGDFFTLDISEEGEIIHEYDKF